MTQAEALKILKSGANVFLTGEPGSGKTFVVNQYVEYLKRAKVEVAVTASTGIAATHLNGMTIHSWGAIGINKTLTKWDLDRISSIERVVKRIERTRVLVIDEISMLDGRALKCVDQVCREVKRSFEPFGGLQVILAGDFFQLPPATRQDEPPAEFAFASLTWKETNPFICYLSEQYRQDDLTLLDILSALRRNQINDEHCRHLDKRRISDLESTARKIPKLFSHNVDVDELNLAELERLPGDKEGFQMRSRGKKALVQQLKRGCLSPENLLLKKGASVMFTKNSPTGEFVNGTLGTVIGFDGHRNYPVVKSRSGHKVKTEPMDWSVEEHGRVLATISQIPLRLAWAMTVHKSQGMSLDAAFMDLRKAFTYGQGYVALSRVRTLAGLYLAGWNETALRVHPEVLSFDKEFRKRSVETGEAFGRIPAVEMTKMHHNFIEACGGKVFTDEPTKTDNAYSVEQARKTHPNAYRSWSENEDKALTEHYQSGKRAGEISELLGRGPGAIRSRLVKLKLIKQ